MLYSGGKPSMPRRSRSPCVKIRAISSLRARAADDDRLWRLSSSLCSGGDLEYVRSQMAERRRWRSRGR